jgi:hypothetical protein
MALPSTIQPLNYKDHIISSHSVLQNPSAWSFERRLRILISPSRLNWPRGQPSFAFSGVKLVYYNANLAAACSAEVKITLSMVSRYEDHFTTSPFTSTYLNNVAFSLTPKEEYRLGLPENRVLRRIFGPKREKVAGGWRRLHNEELHNLYTSSFFFPWLHSPA